MTANKAIVTHLTALQEIASMDILCSDKTGTLTTVRLCLWHALDDLWSVQWNE